jgi:predicted CoA-substrate-specific enzyme activase
VIFAGIDIGSRAAKAVVMKDGEIAASAIRDTGAESVRTSETLLDAVLEGSGITREDITYTVATGYGRVLVPFAQENVSEITAHARGITWYFPGVRTILDMGGQDCKAINCDAEGNVTNFVMNDKCAGGTGRFLEMIADVLGLPLEEIGDVSLQSRNPIPFNTVCAVFAKTEALNYYRKGVAREDILAGLHEAIATRSYNLLLRINIEEQFAITGGISKNSGMVAKLKDKIGMEPMLADDPQLCGALGAALYAEERFSGGASTIKKIQYGYSDGTGEYFITIDTEKCDGCGECVEACPAGIFMMSENDGRPTAVVREELRKRLSFACPGLRPCTAAHGESCRSVCTRHAIELTW